MLPSNVTPWRTSIQTQVSKGKNLSQHHSECRQPCNSQTGSLDAVALIKGSALTLKVPFPGKNLQTRLGFPSPYSAMSMIHSAHVNLDSAARQALSHPGKTHTQKWSSCCWLQRGEYWQRQSSSDSPVAGIFQ